VQRYSEDVGVRAADAQSSSPNFRVLLLGPFAVYRAGELLDTASWQRTVVTLLNLLATAHRYRRLREEVIDILWPDASPEAGSSNLRYVLGLLRKNLGGGDPPPVLSERGWLSLNPAYSWDIDHTRFERLVEGDDRASLSAAMRLIRGRPLEENRYDDWAAPVRERIRRQWTETGLRLADLDRDAGDAPAAISWLETLLEQDPLDEEALRRLLPLLAASGRRTEALRRYGQFEQRLRQELDALPSAETSAVVSSLRGAPSGDPTLATASPGMTLMQPAQGPEPRVGSYLGTLPSGVLVGREEELETVRAAIETAGRGEGRFLLLAGEPGVGKTRLAQEIMRLLAGRGFATVTGRCYEIEQSTAYYPFLDALAELHAGLPASLQQETPRRWPYLARLLPDLVPATLPEASAPDDQASLLRSVLGMVLAASELSPLAILIDDLHWSDMSSLRLLLHIARHTRDSRVFILGAYRDVEVGRHHPLESAILDLAREGLVLRILVRRLNREETATLAAETLGKGKVRETFADLVHRTTEGNPFFIQQVVQGMHERGDLARGAGGWELAAGTEVALTESVRAAIGQRLSRLPETTQEILREASVLGQTFAFDELLAVSNSDEETIEAALDTACTHGLMHALAGDRYGFDHALTRQTIVAELAPRRNRRLHLAAAEAIVKRSGGARGGEPAAAEIAWHFLEGGDDEEALRWSLVAGDTAEAAYAHDEAERHYRTALDIAVELGDPAREAEALEKLGEVLITTACQTEALPLEERALDLYASLADPTGEARAATRIAWAHSGLGSHEVAMEVLRAAIAKLEPLGPSHALADLHAAMADHLNSTGQVDAARANAERLGELAQATGYERYIVGAAIMGAFTLWQMGHLADARPIVEDSLERLEAVRDLFSLGCALQGLGYTYLFEGNLQRAREYFDRALEVNIRRNETNAIAIALTDVAFLNFLEGSWQDARARLEEAAEMVADRVDQPLSAVPLASRDLARIRMGDIEGVESDLERAVQIAARIPGAALLAHVGLAECDLRAGRPGVARSRLENAIATTDDRIGSAMWVYPALMRACLALDDLAGADAALSAVRARQGQPNRILNIELLAVEGEMLARHGDWREADAVLVDALGEAQAIGLPYHEALVRRALGHTAAARGDRRVARRELEHAIAIFQRLGAGPDADQTRARFAAS
jgi:DNA-binding SARP family transcriptional activator